MRNTISRLRKFPDCAEHVDYTYGTCTDVQNTYITMSLIIRTIQLFDTPPFPGKIVVFQAYEHPRLKLLFQYPNTYTSLSSNVGHRTSTKIGRALDTAARRLQVQERLTAQLADAVLSRVQPAAVACRVEAEHLCMSMRGVQKPGHRVVTTAVRFPSPPAADPLGSPAAPYTRPDLLAMLAE